jgi:hypothetical protein
MKRFVSLYLLCLLVCLPSAVTRGQGATPNTNFINQLVDTKIVPSYTALKATKPYAPGTRAWTLGRDSANDGGAGQWYWDSSDTTSAEDGGTILTSTVAGASGRWKRMLPEGRSYDVKWFGAKGDAQVTTGSMTSGSAVLTLDSAVGTLASVGMKCVVFGADEAGTNGEATSDSLFTTVAAVTDSTHLTLAAPAQTTVTGVKVIFGTDDTAAIQAAADALGNNGTLRFPTGNYWVQKGTTGTSACILWNSKSDVRIEGLGKATLVGGWDSEVQSHCYGLEFIGCNRITVTGLGFDIIPGGQPASRRNQACIFFTDAGQGTPDCGDLTVEDCKFTIAASLGSSASSNAGTAMFGVYVSSGGNDDITYPVNTKHIKVINNTFTGCDGRQAEGQAVEDYLVQGNTVIGEGPNGLALGFRFINGCKGVRVVNNYIEDAPTGPNGGQHAGIVFQAGSFNNVAGRRGYGSLAANNHIIIHGSDIANQSVGVYIERQDQPQIRNNVIEYSSAVNNAGYGIRFFPPGVAGSTDGTVGARIVGNRINGWNAAGIYSTDTYASDLQEYQNSYGVKSVDGVTQVTINDSTGIIRQGITLAGTTDTYPTGQNCVFNIHYPADSSTTWDFDPIGLTTASHQMRLFRTTNTTGFVSLAVLTGDNTATTNNVLYGKGGTTGLALNNGDLQLSRSGGKIGFFGTTPVTQPVSGTDLLTGLTNLGLIAGGDTPLNLGSGAFTTTGAVNAGSVTSTGTIKTNTDLRIDAPVSIRDLSWYTSQSSRWSLRVNSTAESGSNAGSDFNIVRRDDTGTFLATNLAINRATGDWTFEDGLDITTGTTNGTKIGTSSTQKLGFFGVTPVTRPAGGADMLSSLTSLGLLTSSSSTPLNLGGGTLTAATLNVDRSASTTRDLNWRTSGNIRWTLRTNSDAESGSNTGSNFNIVRCTDGGAFLANNLTINRNNGDWTFEDGLDIAVGTTNGTKIGTATTQKLGFFGVTPITQPAGNSDILASLVSLGLRDVSSNPPLNMGTGALTCGTISSTGTQTYTPTGTSQQLKTTYSSDISSTLDIDATGLPSNTWSIRVGRNTTVSNVVLQVFKGDNTFTPNASFAGNGNSYVAANNGKFSVGTSTAGAMLNVNGNIQSGVSTPTYGVTVTINADSGNYAKITVTDTNAWTMAAPTNPRTGQTLVVDIVNASGGAMGAITWNAVWKLDSSYANPANGKRRTATFYYDGSNWVQVGAWSGDI